MLYEVITEYFEGIGKITINRERYRNAFRPPTVHEISESLRICREDQRINVIVLTGAGDTAFCAGGDQNVKGEGGYIDKDGTPRLNILEVQKQIRSMPKPVIAMVNGFAIGGGHVLHVVCDITIASENAIFGQTGPKVGSFDAGLGSSYLASTIGQKKAREIWFMCRQYTAAEALEMGLVNKVRITSYNVCYTKLLRGGGSYSCPYRCSHRGDCQCGSGPNGPARPF